MARYNWEVRHAVVEQEIVFRNEIYLKNYLRELDNRYEPYKVVSQEYVNGRLHVIIRKRYLEYPFLGDVDPCVLTEEEIEFRDQKNGVTYKNGVRYVDLSKFNGAVRIPGIYHTGHLNNSNE